MTVPPQHVPNASRYLPKRPPSPPKTEPILAGFNREDASRLQWLITQLTHQVRRHGIRPDHVPALLPAPGEDGLPDSSVWRTRWHSAIALHLLLTHVHGGPTSSARACHAFGTADTDTSLLLDALGFAHALWAMAGLLALRDKFDLAFANDPDYDRHGIVTPAGLMNPNHYLAVAIQYLFTHRTGWSADAAVGKTLVSSSMIDRVAGEIGRTLKEVPVGFKWFVDGLYSGEG